MTGNAIVESPLNTDSMEMDDLFGKFAAGEDVAPAGEQSELDKLAAESQAEEGSSAPGSEGEPDPEGGSVPEGEPAPEPEPKPVDDTLQKILEALKPTDRTPEPPAAPEPAAPKFTAEEQELLDGYVKEWPDVHKAESLIRRAEYQELVQGIFQEIQREFAPLVQFMSTQMLSTHESQIRTAHPDYDTVAEGVQKWINEQPDYLKQAYTHVASQGSTQQVIDLVSRYKQASGITAAPPAVAAKTIAPAARAVAQRMAPVASKRTTVPAVEDDGDEETMFARFAKEERRSA